MVPGSVQAQCRLRTLAGPHTHAWRASPRLGLGGCRSVSAVCWTQPSPRGPPRSTQREGRSWPDASSPRGHTDPPGQGWGFACAPHGQPARRALVLVTDRPAPPGPPGSRRQTRRSILKTTSVVLCRNVCGWVELSQKSPSPAPGSICSVPSSSKCVGETGSGHADRASLRTATRSSSLVRDGRTGPASTQRRGVPGGPPPTHQPQAGCSGPHDGRRLGGPSQDPRFSL